MTTRTTSLSTARRIAFTFTSFVAAPGVEAEADAGAGADDGGAVVAAGTGVMRVAGCASSQAIGSAVWPANLLLGYSDVTAWNRRSAAVRSRDSPNSSNASRASVAARHSASSQNPLVGCCRTTRS